MSFDINKWKKFLNENEVKAYHGSKTKGIKKFLLNKADPTSHSGFGLFFTDNLRDADHYGPNIYQVSLNVKPITGIGWDEPVPQDLLNKIKQDYSDLPENLDGKELMEWLKSKLGAVEGAKYLVDKGVDHYYHKLDDPVDGMITAYKVLDDSVISDVKEMSK
jgi:hypothetical protein